MMNNSKIGRFHSRLSPFSKKNEGNHHAVQRTSAKNACRRCIFAVAERAIMICLVSSPCHKFVAENMAPVILSLDPSRGGNHSHYARPDPEK
jgi:hypothetical protein